eukprot:4919961-Lingulodinium_polyedra.AAC.1
MVEPTEDELRGISTCDQVAEWCGIDAGAGGPRAVLYAALGCSGATGLRALGRVPADDFERL